MAWDTDGEGLSDLFEITYGLDPTTPTDTIADDDNDGLDLQGEQDYGSDPTNPDTDGDGINDGQEASTGTSPTSGDSDGDGVPDGFEITLKAKVATKSSYKYGFATYTATTPPQRYLKEVVSWTNMSGGNPESGPIGVGPGTRTREIDPLTGYQTTMNTGVGGSYPYTATSPTTQHDTITIYSYDDPPNEIGDDPGTVTADAVLSNENTTATLKQTTANNVPAYPADFSNYGTAYQDLSTDEFYYSLAKLKYKFKFGKSIQASLTWVEMFRPEDKPDTQNDESQDPTFTAKTWSGTAAETTEFEVNPYQIDPSKDGSYEILYVDSVYADYTDPETHGIPSNQYDVDVRGKTHFVCVKNTGDIVLRAYLSTWVPEPGLNKITWECTGGTVTSPAVPGANGSKLTAKLSSATPGKYPVTMKVDGQVLWQGIVWVVWCDLQANTSGTSSLTNDPLGLLSARSSSSYRAEAGIQWNATIQPPSIITDTDRPAIDKQKRQAPPGGTEFANAVPTASTGDATGSKFSGWDVSRRIRDRWLYGNPSKTPPEALVMTQPSDPVNPAFMTPSDFPFDTAVGNDDRGAADEDDNPYDVTKGTLRSFDSPGFSRIDSVDYFNRSPGEDGDTLRTHQRFGEFARVQLGQIWYRCSDFGVWRFDWSMKRVSGQWNAEAGQTDAFDLSDPNPLDF